MSTQHTILDLFAGPGGWDRGAEIAGIDPATILGVELDEHAVKTARAAGYNRLHANVLDLDPAEFPHITGLIASPPCPTFSTGGKGSGRVDYQTVLDGVTCLGDEECECTWDEVLESALGSVQDERTVLALTALRFMFKLENLEWVILEQVPALEYMWDDIAAELFSAGWEYVDVGVVDAVNFGSPARRKRAFLIAHKTKPVSISQGDPAATMVSTAEALGWAAGDQVRTRNNRRPTGGNLFSADEPSWCLTGSARSWTRESTGEQLHITEASVLNGFPIDFPWSGSRTRQFLQAGNVVIPIVAASLLAQVAA